MKLKESQEWSFASEADRQLYEAILENFRGTPLFEEFQREQEEILRHKWLESEKVGKDIGFEQALTSWMVQHRNEWVSNGRMLAQRMN